MECRRPLFLNIDITALVIFSQLRDSEANSKEVGGCLSEREQHNIAKINISVAVGNLMPLLSVLLVTGEVWMCGFFHSSDRPSD